MRRSLLICMLVCGFCAYASGPGAVQAASVVSVLPHGARVEAQLNVPGYRNAVALTFVIGKDTRIGAVSEANGRYFLRWSRDLGPGTWSMSAPGPKGLLQGVRAKSAAGVQKFFAYVVRGTQVSSAITGKTSGELTGNRGVVVKPNRFTIRRHDSAHVGSVLYRFDTTYAWTGTQYVAGAVLHVPDYPKGLEPTPSVSLRAQNGSIALIRVQIADTEAKRESGLMNVKSMDPDSGMIFVWQTPVLEAFWMRDTYIPLSIAWIDSSMKVIDIQEMLPLDDTLHSPPGPYLYAIEANKGYFENNGIHVGDTVQLHLQG